MVHIFILTNWLLLMVLVPWADNYRSMDEIPAEEYWEEGWYIPCNDCGKEVYEGEGVEVGKTVYCHDCWNARKENAQ